MSLDAVKQHVVKNHNISKTSVSIGRSVRLTKIFQFLALCLAFLHSLLLEQQYIYKQRKIEG